jgi:NAD+ kinase
VQLVDASPTFGLVTCDGRRGTELRSGATVEIARGRHRLRLARLSTAPFTDRLVNKFGLRVEGWRGLAELDPEHRPGPPTRTLAAPTG